MNYQETIDMLQKAQEGRVGGLRGTCHQVSVCLTEIHPELKLVRGHYVCAYWGDQPHWWAVDPEGNVVDPTKEQFPSKGHGVYLPLDESQPEPTGKCPNCSGLCYDGGYCCSEKCAQEYADYCSGKTSL